MDRGGRGRGGRGGIYPAHYSRGVIYDEPGDGPRTEPQSFQVCLYYYRTQRTNRNLLLVSLIYGLPLSFLPILRGEVGHSTDHRAKGVGQNEMVDRNLGIGTVPPVPERNWAEVVVAGLLWRVIGDVIALARRTTDGEWLLTTAEKSGVRKTLLFSFG